MRLFVINLDRRADRLRNVEILFAEHALDFHRVSAVDGKRLSHPDTRLATPAEIGCWESHQLAFRAIAEGDEIGVVFEDDVVLSKKHFNYKAFLVGVETLINHENVNFDLLQLGYIEEPYRWWTRRGLLDFALSLSGGRRKTVRIAQRKFRLVEASFRAGAHAYAITPRGAAKILGFNLPVARGADDFLGDLASRFANGHEGFRVARLSSSYFSQKSRVSRAISIDSDINS